MALEDGLTEGDFAVTVDKRRIPGRGGCEVTFGSLQVVTGNPPFCSRAKIGQKKLVLPRACKTQLFYVAGFVPCGRTTPERESGPEKYEPKM